VKSPVLLAVPAAHGRGEPQTLAGLPAPLDLEALVPGSGRWEVEIGFGKGRYLLARAAAEPEQRFLGIEVAGEYFARLEQRARKRGLANLLAVRGAAELVMATMLPHGFARAVHVYFPDPWPKARHERRRLFDADSVDLVLSLLAPGGRLYFATDFLAYGEHVQALLAGHPRVSVRALDEGWPEGPRTNYEAKYVAAGRPILRLEVGWAGAEGAQALHPAGARGLLAAYREPAGPADEPSSRQAGLPAAPH
jgi:tRNA (guanine-N7-)-methyltransferase